LSSIPAGWYTDPLGRFDERYWDGFQWTAHIRMGRTEGTDPLGIQYDSGPGPAPGRPNENPAIPPGGWPVSPPAGPSAHPVPPNVPQAPQFFSAPSMPTVSGFAIASLVLGILWIYWIGTVLALVFGYIALSQIKRSNGWKTGRGMAIAGVVLGYVGVAVLALVIVLVATSSHHDSRINTDPYDGVCNQSRFLQDPDC
jgi:Domain of unknown function (DUF4190)/Protein of unknown function (DUF2510)